MTKTEAEKLGLEQIYTEVEKLKELKIHEQIIETLQNIEKIILNEYIIKINDIIIEPVLIEMYYFNQNIFEDYSVHASHHSSSYIYERSRQKNHFGELYVHKQVGDGIDVCLSFSDDFYLSFLIKNGYINGNFLTQWGIGNFLCKNCKNFSPNKANCQMILKETKCKYNNDNATVLIKKNSTNKKILFLPRKGIRYNFMCANLAAIPIDELSKNYKFSLQPTSSKNWMCAIAALCNNINNLDEANEFAKKHKWSVTKIDKYYWAIANNDINKFTIK